MPSAQATVVVFCAVLCAAVALAPGAQEPGEACESAGMPKKSADTNKRRRGGGGERGGGAAATEAPSVSQKELAQPFVVAQHDGGSKLQEQLLTVPAVLTPAECAQWVAFAESLGMASTRPAGGKPVRGTAYRDNFRTQVNDPDIAAALWGSGLGLAIQQVTTQLPDGRVASGFNDNIRLYKYEPGLRFGKHYDSSDTDSLGRQTFYTVLIYLSACGGGETVFYAEHGGGETARITPQEGLALFHKHGVDCWQHEALAVTSGTKYVLRTDVVYA